MCYTCYQMLFCTSSSFLIRQYPHSANISKFKYLINSVEILPALYSVRTATRSNGNILAYCWLWMSMLGLFILTIVNVERFHWLWSAT